ncbi:MAG: sporulation protein YqfD, partial [Clostridia bacterium]|nr:sporulation protein YqfD [Clostridia bacterium]
LLSLLVYRGETVLSPGVAVNPGDVIASHEVHGVIPGTKELSGAVRFVHARGEAIARIEGKLSAVMPKTRLQKRYTGRETRENLLFFAETPIFFLKPYGIPYARCDTIRNRVDLSLPAGRLLPFFRVETVSSEYETELIPVARDEAYEMLSELADRTLLRGAKDGKLEELSCRIREDGDLWRLDADYIMTEDIGEERLLSPLP